MTPSSGTSHLTSTGSRHSIRSTVPASYSVRASKLAERNAKLHSGLDGDKLCEELEASARKDDRWKRVQSRYAKRTESQAKPNATANKPAPNEKPKDKADAVEALPRGAGSSRDRQQIQPSGPSTPQDRHRAHLRTDHEIPATLPADPLSAVVQPSPSVFQPAPYARGRVEPGMAASSTAPSRGPPQGDLAAGPNLRPPELRDAALGTHAEDHEVLPSSLTSLSATASQNISVDFVSQAGQAALQPRLRSRSPRTRSTRSTRSTGEFASRRERPPRDHRRARPFPRSKRSRMEVRGEHAALRQRRRRDWPEDLLDHRQPAGSDRRRGRGQIRSQPDHHRGSRTTARPRLPDRPRSVAPPSSAPSTAALLQRGTSSARRASWNDPSNIEATGCRIVPVPRRQPQPDHVGPPGHGCPPATGNTDSFCQQNRSSDHSATAGIRLSSGIGRLAKQPCTWCRSRCVTRRTRRTGPRPDELRQLAARTAERRDDGPGQAAPGPHRDAHLRRARRRYRLHGNWRRSRSSPTPLPRSEPAGDSSWPRGENQRAQESSRRSSQDSLDHA